MIEFGNVRLLRLHGCSKVRKSLTRIRQFFFIFRVIRPFCEIHVKPMLQDQKFVHHLGKAMFEAGLWGETAASECPIL
jgi:hypothetical protein